MAIGSSGSSGGSSGTSMMDSFTNLGDKIQNNAMAQMENYANIHTQKAKAPQEVRLLRAQARNLELQNDELYRKKKWNENLRRIMLGGR
jgi:hypothetical protein